jgi:hypothetical protein
MLTPAEKYGKLDAAIGNLREVREDLRLGEYGQWEGFYTLGDWFIDVPLTLRLAEVCRSHVVGRPLSPAEQETLALAERINRENTSYVFKNIKPYQAGQKVRFCEPGEQNNNLEGR